MKVWLLTNTPSSYQVELLGAIQRSGLCELDVRFMRGVHRGQPAVAPAGGLRSVNLGGIGTGWRADAFRFHPRAAWEALQGRYDFYVLSGLYTSVTFVLCALLLTLRRKPWAAWLEQPWPEHYRPEWSGRLAAKSDVARRMRRTLLRKLLGRASRILCIGTVAMEAYEALGIARAKLAVLPYHCDTERFAHVDENETAEIRGHHDLEGRTVFLFSGVMVKRKGADLLLDAFRQVADKFPRAALLLLGNGELRAELEASVPGPLRDRVHFAGQVDYKDLPAYFAAADVFVLPSRHDGWGVVVNEACAAGLPVITTRAVGAARDLVRDGHNGFVIARDDVKSLAEKMAFFALDPERAREFGARSLEIIGGFTLAKGVERFCALAQAAVGLPPGSAGSDRSD
ncbi:MAG: glycosyltransferase family 4 protein [Kiritimatiellae bacterium]|nr:glycosyltransferase family 4 protein [Kiritimatiellia bacterium]